MSSAAPKNEAVNPAGYLIGLDDKADAALLAASVRDVLVRIDRVSAITGLSVPTIYRLMSQDKFPRPVKITTTARAWKLSEITAWVESRERTTARRSARVGSLASSPQPPAASPMNAAKPATIIARRLADSDATEWRQNHNPRQQASKPRA